MAADAPASSALTLLAQAERLPAEFREHFFDTPLAVRVEVNSKYMAEAMLVLTRDDRVQLIELTDTRDSEVAAGDRQRWVELLAEPHALGPCVDACSNGLLALDYSLGQSSLSIVTQDAERDASEERFYSLPTSGGNGLMLRNQLNMTGGERSAFGRYAIEALGSVGQWTTSAQAEVDRIRRENHTQDRYRLSGLYADRVVEDQFYRLGYFTPATQGLSRRPRTLSGLPDGALGLTFGSSDSLAIDNGQPSSTPIYVTPNRPGVIEVYRNGSLINSQPVQPGLQTIDTRTLPGL